MDTSVPGGPAIINTPVRPTKPPTGKWHEGGFASEHGPDVFEGTLKDSEIFAKLLKGEYVASEDQMRTFLKKTLPSIATEASNMLWEEKKALKAKGRASLDVEPISKSSTTQPPKLTIEPIKIPLPTTQSAGGLIKQ